MWLVAGLVLQDFDGEPTSMLERCTSRRPQETLDGRCHRRSTMSCTTSTASSSHAICRDTEIFKQVRYVDVFIVLRLSSSSMNVDAFDERVERPQDDRRYAESHQATRPALRSLIAQDRSDDLSNSRIPIFFRDRDESLSNIRHCGGFRICCRVAEEFQVLNDVGRGLGLRSKTFDLPTAPDFESSIPASFKDLGRTTIATQSSSVGASYAHSYQLAACSLRIGKDPWYSARMDG
ncbi:hypothetical protein SCHPADRAFT_955018 [Schizopora paradoxa]|uniref:Uncharacterized protein n=1 Tax=Schizopora paradoxa TaxID=27342 RepID=A0A0H2S9U8_9AGAM|nr:hypothetical protein SCHPADRAFT_955018 [Schizopora paradoxa]